MRRGRKIYYCISAIYCLLQYRCSVRGKKFLTVIKYEVLLYDLTGIEHILIFKSIWFHNFQ